MEISVPLYGHITFCFSICQLMDMRVVSTFGLLRIPLLWTLLWRVFCGWKFWKGFKSELVWNHLFQRADLGFWPVGLDGEASVGGRGLVPLAGLPCWPALFAFLLLQAEREDVLGPGAALLSTWEAKSPGILPGGSHSLPLLLEVSQRVTG